MRLTSSLLMRTSNDTSSRSMLTPLVRFSATWRTASMPCSESSSKSPSPMILPLSPRQMFVIRPTTCAPS